MPKTAPTNDDEYSPQETEERRDEVLRRMLNTPPQPHADKGKSRVEKTAEAERAGKEKP